jgi:hypothetical protein
MVAPVPANVDTSASEVLRAEPFDSFVAGRANDSGHSGDPKTVK